jgi:hypothetical protein
MLFFISFFIRGIAFEEKQKPPEDQNKKEEENEDFKLPLIK